MGNAGKSSLAARIANRMRGHQTVVLVDQYGPDAVMYELERALPAERRAPFLDTWRVTVDRSADALKDALESLLTGAFSGKDGTQPILLVIDDLEQRLKQPQPGETATPFKSAGDMVVFSSIIAAFRDARSTRSRLLITSRYTFSLTDRREGSGGLPHDRPAAADGRCGARQADARRRRHRRPRPRSAVEGPLGAGSPHPGSGEWKPRPSGNPHPLAARRRSRCRRAGGGGG